MYIKLEYFLRFVYFLVQRQSTLLELKFAVKHSRETFILSIFDLYVLIRDQTCRQIPNKNKIRQVINRYQFFVHSSSTSFGSYFGKRGYFHEYRQNGCSKKLKIWHIMLRRDLHIFTSSFYTSSWKTLHHEEFLTHTVKLLIFKSGILGLLIKLFFSYPNWEKNAFPT